MSAPGPMWKGLFEWSTKNMESGNVQEQRELPRQMKADDIKWMEEAMAQYTVDVTKRMRNIKARLEADDEGVPGKEALLEELLDIVTDLDYARDLKTIGGLGTLMELLSSRHAGLRWRAAEVVGTCAQNHPPVQQWLLDAEVLPHLTALAGDADATVRAKALLALSCLLRGSAQGLAAFRAAHGLDLLTGALQDSDARVQRKALQLMRHLLQEQPQDTLAAHKDGASAQAGRLLSSDDADVRCAALALLVQEAGQSREVAEHLHADAVMQQHLAEASSRLEQLHEKEDAAEERAMLEQLHQQLRNPGRAGAAAAQARAPEPQRQQQKQPEQALPLLLGPA